MTDPRLSLHLRRDRDYETVVATVEAHPASPARVVLRNAGTPAWAMRPDGEIVKTVDPGRRLAVHTMTIDFGSVRGGSSAVNGTGPPRRGGPVPGRHNG